MTTTYAGLTNEQRTFYETAMLVRAIPAFPHIFWGQKGIYPPQSIPENEGDVISWRKLAALSAVTTPLTEGVTPDPEDITITATTGTVVEYGAFVRYTKKLAAMGIDNVAAEAADALGEQSGDSLDQLVRTTLGASGSAQYASTAVSTATVDNTMFFTAAEALEALATLKNNKAVPVMDRKYIAIIHPYTEHDLFRDATFQSILSYVKDDGNMNPWISGYCGDGFGFKFYVSPNAYVESAAGAGGIDVYHTLALGKSSFGIGGLASEMPGAVSASEDESNTGKKIRPIKLIDHPFGSAGTSDPLDQRATMGWYTTFVSTVLDSTFYINVEHATRLG